MKIYKYCNSNVNISIDRLEHIINKSSRREDEKAKVKGAHEKTICAFCVNKIKMQKNI